jgi:hypothetical protein
MCFRRSALIGATKATLRAQSVAREHAVIE